MTHPSKDSAEGARKRCGTKEEGNTVVLLLSLVPHGEIEDHTREKATFSQAKKESRREEARHVLGHSKKRSDNAPDERQSW